MHKRPGGLTAGSRRSQTAARRKRDIPDATRRVARGRGLATLRVALDLLTSFPGGLRPTAFVWHPSEVCNIRSECRTSGLHGFLKLLHLL